MIGKKEIKEFYTNKKIAVVGASRSRIKYGNMLFEELRKKGFDVVPVNPSASEINGVKAYPALNDIPGGIKAAIAVVPPSEQEKVAADAASAGLEKLWIHEHIMKGISNTKAIAICENNSVICITGFCPMMFIPGSGMPHNIHKAIIGLFGALPK